MLRLWADIDADDTDSHTIETDEDEDEVSSEKKISIDLSVDSGVNIDDPVRMYLKKLVAYHCFQLTKKSY